MPERSSSTKSKKTTRRGDRNASSATEKTPNKPAKKAASPAKDPIAVELGRRGGLKGGKARAKTLTKTQRVAQAKKAAQARWDKSSQSEVIKKPSRKNQLNDLTAKEWIAETVSVWTQKGLGKGHPDAQIEREHPAPFSYQDVARLIRFFTKRGQAVLDPFLGVGSTLKAAALEGRKGIGIELNSKYSELAKLRIKNEVSSAPDICEDQTILQGDAAKLLPTLEPESINLVLTSPPYWNILHKEDHKAKQERVSNGLDAKYSEFPEDLGNITDYQDFLAQLTDILGLCYPLLVAGGHMCIVVGDFRHKSKYYMFHADLATSLSSRGFTLKGLKILYQRHKRVFPYGYPYAYVPNLHHQYIIIVRKND